jgi:hypothetical protein
MENLRRIYVKKKEEEEEISVFVKTNDKIM